jgi:endonuclease/exonuclease/phosphatase family metal-dependent hydrolase
MKRLRNRFGLRGFACVDAVGQSGGLALYWHESLTVDVKEKNDRYIDVHMQFAPNDPMVHVTFVYGEPRTENRHRMWSSLAALRASSTLPWVLLGDFNEALWQYEHFSIRPRPEAQMAAFRDCVQLCNLHDLGFTGLPYTYDNKRAGSANVKVRLDRVLAGDRWRDIYANSSVVHLVSPCSDHCPILLSLAREVRTPVLRKFPQYEIFWERDPGLKDLIDTA